MKLKHHALLWAGLAIGAAHAQDCLPFNQPGVSSRAVRVTSPAGEAYAWWCAAKDAAGVLVWSPRTFTVLTRYRDLPAYARASASAAASSNVAAAGYAELAKATKAPAAGEEAYQFALLRNRACTTLVNGPAPGEWSKPYCPPAPAPVATAWVVGTATGTGTQAGTRPAYPWAAGVRGTLSNGRATSGQPCNTAVGAAPYFGVNNRTDQVALCVLL